MNEIYSTLNIGQKLRKLRNEKGFSQEYLADRLNISQKTYSNMENDRTPITVEILKQLSSELEVDMIDLITDSKIIVQYNTSQDTSTFNGVVNNNFPEELVNQLKERIIDLKNQLLDKDKMIDFLQKKTKP